MKLTAIVNNLPTDLSRYAYIVARACEGELWYYGAWNDAEGAAAQARQVDGIVLRVES